MMRIVTVALATLLGIWLGVGSAASQAEDLSTAARSAQPLSAQDIRTFFSGKTWLWPNGGAFYDSVGRRYSAATDDGSYAEGVWFAANGKICTRALWHGDYRPSMSARCNSMRVDDKGRTLMRREPDGQWWIFRNARERPGDESLRFVDGNQIRDRFLANKKRYPDFGIFRFPVPRPTK